MVRRFEVTTGFSSGVVSKEYHHKVGLDVLAEGVKSGENVMLDRAGGIMSRYPFVNVDPAWQVFAPGVKAIPFKGQGTPYAVLYRVASALTLLQIDVFVYDLSAGAVVATQTFGSLLNLTTPDNIPHYVQYENTLIITSAGVNPITVTHNGGGAFTISAPQFYKETSGVGIRLTNGSTTVTALDVKKETTDPLGDISTEITRVSRYDVDLAGATVVRILGQDYQLDPATPPTVDTFTLLTPWQGETIDLPFNVAVPRTDNFFPRGVAFFQGRAVYIADYYSATTPRRLSVTMSSTYDPFVIGPAVQMLGQNPSSPIDVELRLGRDSELMWVVGGDTLTIGGAEQEYSLANPLQAITPEQLPVFRITSNYGSATDAVAYPDDGRILFSPKAGGALLSLKHQDSEQRFTAEDLAPLSPNLMEPIASIAVFEKTSIDPVTRILAATKSGGLIIGSYTDIGKFPGWFAQKLPPEITIHNVLEIDNEIYLFVEKGIVGNPYTFLRWDVGNTDYTLDLYEAAVPIGAGPYYTQFQVTDDYLGGDLFTVSTRTYRRLALASLTGEFQFDEVVNLSSGGSGRVHLLGDGFIELRVPTGTFTNGATITGASSGATATLVVSTTRVSTRAYEPVSGTSFTISNPADSIVVGKQFVSSFEPLNALSADELGATKNRKHRVLSARLRYTDTRQLYINNSTAVGDITVPMDLELPLRSGVFRKTFLGGWREQDTFLVRSVVPYSMHINDLSREVVS